MYTYPYKFQKWMIESYFLLPLMLIYKKLDLTNYRFSKYF